MMNVESNELRRTERKRIDHAVITQHDRLAKRIVWSLILLFIGLAVFLRSIYVTVITDFTPDDIQWGEWGIYGLLLFLFGVCLVLIFSTMIAHLPSGEDHTVSTVRNETKPAHITIERIAGRTTTISRLDWDMDTFEAGGFAHAVAAAEWKVSRPIIKRGTDIVNINDRYGGWLVALESVGGVERIGNRYHVTDDGREILSQYLPHSE